MDMRKDDSAFHYFKEGTTGKILPPSKCKKVDFS